MAKRTKPPHKATPSTPTSAPAGERLQKILAAAGLGSRRDCEELILAGRVEVDRRVVNTLGTKANPQEQEIRIDGEILPRPKLVHYMVNKPVGVVTTNADPAGRPRVIDLVPHKGSHLFAVGRLDMSSEGLILVTNDGDLANRLTHPRYGVEKTYHVEVAGKLDNEQLQELRKGVYLSEGFAKVVGATIKKQMGKSTLVEVLLDEGKNREIRRLLARVGHKVLRLKRIAIGPLRLGELPTGAFRPLSYEELDKLKETGTRPIKSRGARGAQRAGKGVGFKGKRPARPDGARRTEPMPRPVTGSVIGGDAPAKARPAARPVKKPGRKPARRPSGGPRP